MLLNILLRLSTTEWLPGFLRSLILRALDSWRFATLETTHYARVYEMSSCQVTEEYILFVHLLGQKLWLSVSPETYRLIQPDSQLLVEFEMTRVKRRIRNIKMAPYNPSSYAPPRLKNIRPPAQDRPSHWLH